MHRAIALRLSGLAVLTVVLIALGPAVAAEGPDLDPTFRSIYEGEVQGEKDNLFLSKKEARRIENRAREELGSRLLSYYRIISESGDLRGYAFLQTRTIRTKPGTFLVALDTEGKVMAVRVLGWGEPPEYKPSRRWLAQFDDRAQPKEIELGSGIHGMSGASYTGRTLTAAVRWTLAVQRVKLTEE